MNRILQQIPIRSFTKKKFWTTTMAMLLFFMVLGALKAQAQTQTFCPGATVSNLTSTPPAGYTTTNWFTTLSGGTALEPTVPLNTGTYYVEYATPLRTTILGSGFNQPTGIAVVQADYKILVADAGNNAIKRVNADNTGLVTLGSGFSNPTAVAVQADGKILVADFANNAIKRMNADGTGIITLGTGFLNPYGVAVQAADGKIVVVDIGNNAIKRMNSDGTGIVTLGSGFSDPVGVAIQADGKILVVDSGNNAIKRMDTDGTNIVTLGAGFITPISIAVQPNGKILVGSVFPTSIKRMNADGTGIVTLASSALGSGIDGPYGITVRDDGTIFVADRNNNAIKRITEISRLNRLLVDVVVISPVTTNFAAIPAFCAGTTAPTLATTSPNGVAGTWSPATVSNTANASYVFTPTLSCNAGQTLVVTVNPVATSNFATIPAFCAGTIAPTLATTSPNGVVGTWSPATISNTASGSYVFTPTATCNVGQTLSVTVNPTATSNFTAIPAFCAGTIAPILPTTSPNGVAGTWSPATISNTTSASYVFTPTAACNIGQTLAVTVNAIPNPPTALATQVYAGSGTIANLTITGATIQWYTAATAGSLLPTATPLVDGTTYYASQTVSGCVSLTRVAVTVRKISEATQTFCAPATVANLASTPNAGSTVNWFTSLSGGTALGSTAPLTSGPYYVEQSTPLTITTLGSGFRNPTFVAVQADGKILVADYNNNAIKRMNTDGTVIETLGSGFINPSAVAVQANGKILVADSNNGVIKRMNADGTGIEELFSGVYFSTPNGVAVQADSKILVADSGNNAIKRMNSDGTGIVTLASGFSFPHAVAVQADGRILVADSGNNAIKRMNTDGTGIETLGSGFNAPRGVAVQADGKILVADTNNNVIKRMNADGTGIVILFSGFNIPYGVALQVDGNILVADSGNSAIKRFTQTVSNRVAVNVVVNPSVTSNFATIPVFCAGTTAPILATTSPNGVAGTWSPATISSTASGSYVFTPTTACNVGQTLAVTVNPTPNPPTALATQVYAGSGTIANLTATGAMIKWYTAATAGSQLPTTTPLVDGITYYVTQTSNTCESARTAVTVRKISEATQTFCAPATVANLASTPSNGATANWFSGLSGGTALGSTVPLTTGTYYVAQSGTIITALASDFSGPYGIAVQADGKILVADTGNSSIKRMNANGTGIVTIGSGFNFPYGVAAQADGKILVADSNNNSIKRMNTDGTGIVTLGSGFYLPYGVAVQADGKILVVDTGNGAIKRMNADGTNIVTLGSGFIQPFGVAVQADGKIVVADYNNSTIKRMNADGSNIVILTSDINVPVSVAVQADGKIVVVDSNSNNVKRINSDGTGLVTIATGFDFQYSVAGVAVQADGKILVADSNINTIKNISEQVSNRVAVSVVVNPVVTSNFASIPAFCAGATAPALATTSPNGVAGTWSPATISNTTSGNYVFTPTAACNIGQTLAVTVNPVATSNFAAIPAFCAGTTAPTLALTSPNGVIGTWSPATISNNASGSYVFTPTAVCNVGQTLTVTVNPVATSNFTLIPAFCAGTTAPTLASTSPNGVAGTWSPATISNTASGSYVFTPTAACNVGQTLAVTVNPVATSNFTLIPAFCAGTTAPTLASTSPNGVAGTWSPATISNTASGSYVFTPTLSCNTGQTLSITVNTINASSSISQVSCNGGSNGDINVFNVSGGTAPYSYLWNNGATSFFIGGLSAGTYSCTITDSAGCSRLLSGLVISQPTAITSIITASDVSCNSGTNGTASIAVSGGTPGYTYNWTPGNPTGDGTSSVTGLAAGNYTCTVTDANGCQTARFFNITQPTTALNGTRVLTNSCFGGSTGAINLTTTGGTAPYTFNWGNGITTEDRTGLAAGTYSVIITDANGCTAIYTSIILQFSAITANTSQTNVSCRAGSNGTATIVASGGAGSYTYSWLPSGGTGATATGLVSGTYTCTVTDANGCTIARVYTITQPTAIAATITQTNVSCNSGVNGAASIAVSGGTSGYTYNWTPGNPAGNGTASVTGLTAGNYTCTVTDANGCNAIRPFTITQPPALNNSVSQALGVITASLSTFGTTYQWYQCPNTLISGETNQTYTPAAAGDYKVEVTIAGCTATSSCITVSTLGNESFNFSSKLTVYPNPSSDVFYINGDTRGSFVIYDLIGKIIKTETIDLGITKLDLSNYPSGIYLMKVTNDSNQTKTMKLIKQ